MHSRSTSHDPGPGPGGNAGHGNAGHVDGGLTHDLPHLLGRRRLLTLLGAGGAALVVGCASESRSSATSPSTVSTSAAAPGSGSATPTTVFSGSATELACDTIAAETPGPFPADGSNGPNVLADSGAVRKDVRSSYGSASGVADGVPLVVDMVILDTANGCAPMPGAAVYMWQCDREARYSLYSEGATEENYLRGVQEADAEGRVTFLSIVPGAYPGRWPHIHFEVYASLAAATSSDAAVVVSQIALPADACAAAYAAPGYEESARTFEGTSIDDDGVFGDDGGATQLATAEGSVDSGFSVELSVPV